MSATFNAATLRDAAGISKHLADIWFKPILLAIDSAELNTAERVAMFIAQCAHESAGFALTEESLNYTPQALIATWPNRFSQLLANKLGRTDAKPADQIGIALAAYGGRMGNAPAPSTDGWDYRGRGLIQVTGKNNYRAFGEWCANSQVPSGFMLNKPQDLAKPSLAAMSAAWFWDANKLNKWADVKDVDTASRVINLGSATTKAIPHGLDDRRKRFRLALSVMTGRK